jgi:hypothetical protein
VGNKRADYEEAAKATQRAFRGYKGRRKANKRKGELQEAKQEEKSALAIQKVARGKKERARTGKMAQERKADKKVRDAAVKIQSFCRKLIAVRRVSAMKKDLMERRDRAATKIRSMIKGYLARHVYLEKLSELASRPLPLLVVQRYARGYLVRKRLLESARRAQLELWAAQEAQRMYRGYRGRLAWEAMYEETWSREIASLRIQRAFRGFMGRRKIYWLRKKYIRAEFAIAKHVFRSAQKIQARIRGKRSRQETLMRMQATTRAVLVIQRIYRGHRLRVKLWEAVLYERATRIQSHARGMLVRIRAAELGHHVRVIQRQGRKYIARKEASSAGVAAGIPATPALRDA